MFLQRIHLNLRCREARRDLADPYQLHSTLCRAFSPPDQKCLEGEFLWRLEPETDSLGPRILVQSRAKPDWGGISGQGWLSKADPSIDLIERLNLDSLKSGQRFRFRLRANPCVKRNGKRLGLLHLEEQEGWLARKGLQHGFSLSPTMFVRFFKIFTGANRCTGFPGADAWRENSIPVTQSGYIRCYTMDFSP